MYHEYENHSMVLRTNLVVVVSACELLGTITVPTKLDAVYSWQYCLFESNLVTIDPKPLRILNITSLLPWLIKKNCSRLKYVWVSD